MKKILKSNELTLKTLLLALAYVYLFYYFLMAFSVFITFFMHFNLTDESWWVAVYMLGIMVGTLYLLLFKFRFELLVVLMIFIQMIF